MLMNVPRNLAALCKIAARQQQHRFEAMCCVQLLDQGNGLYRAVATNGRIAAIIAGPFDDLDAPGLLQAASAVNGEKVEVLYYRPGTPLGVIASNDAGQAFDGLIVPLTRSENPKKVRDEMEGAAQAVADAISKEMGVEVEVVMEDEPCT